MEVGDRTKKLAKQAANQKSLVKAFGPQCGKRFFQRLVQFDAARCLEVIGHLPPARIHELKGNREGQFSADLKHPYRLIFIPADDAGTRKADGGWDWAQITAIEILEVTDTHD